MYMYMASITFIIFSFLTSDGWSLRQGPGSAQAQHLEGLLELGFCRLDPSIGWVKPQAQASGLRLGLGSSSEFGGSTHHYLSLNHHRLHNSG